MTPARETPAALTATSRGRAQAQRFVSKAAPALFSEAPPLEIRGMLGAGERVVRTRFGVDDATCSGDHSCIRLSGCPSLTVKPSADPLKVDPVAHVNNQCVGCGLCGEVAHAAILCPSFYRAEIVQNPNAWDRFIARLRASIVGWLQPA